MKKIICLFLIVLSTVFIENVKAQSNANGGVFSFEILPEYLLNGKLIISPNLSIVTFKYNVKFVRNLNGNSGTNKWKPIDVKVKMSVPQSNGSIEYFGDWDQILNSSFENNDDAFLTKTYTITIPKTAFTSGNPLYLAILFPGMPSPTNSNKGYHWELGSYSGPSTPVVTPPSSQIPVPGSIPLYEYYNSGSDVFYYSTTFKSYPNYQHTRVIGYLFTTQQVGTVPLYLYSTPGKYLYTINPAVENLNNWSYREVVGYVYANQVTKSRPVYRLYNASTGKHYLNYEAGTKTGYEIEDIVFHMLQNTQNSEIPHSEDNTMEFYQYYNPQSKDHYYTTRKSGNNGTSYTGYNYEGVLGYIHSIQKPGTVPLYQYLLTFGSGNHYYTLNKQNYSGYKYEGIAGYVYNNSGYSNTMGIYSYYNNAVVDHYYTSQNASFPGYSNEGIKFYLTKYY